MDELILKQLRGELAEFERHALERWLAESRENAVYARRVTALWELAEQAMPVPLTPPAAATIVAAARNASQLVVERATLWRAAAVVGVLASGSMIYWAATRADRETTSTDFVAGAKAPVTLGLEDGSTVRLAPHSRLRLSAGRMERRATLTGTAFFAVAKDAHRPFVIEAGTAEIRVTGTRFEVRQGPGTLRVVLLEGSLSLKAAGQVLSVRPGQVVHADAGAVSVETVANPRSLLDWPGGLLIFKDTPLGDAAREVGEEFGRRVRIVPGVATSLTISASFEGESFEETVTTLCAITATTCSVADSLTTIAP